MSALVLGLALLADLGLGEPPRRWHPVVWMGAAITALERLAPAGRPARLAWGAAMAAVIPAGFGGAAWLLLAALPGWAAPPVAAALLWTAFAARGLARAAETLARALEAGDLGAARDALTSLCSRDPSALAAEELAAAGVESVAENASDSIVAPLFWFVLLGVPGAVAYRAVNTMDAMIGYRSPRHEALGKAAARLDDLVNLIPARLTALLLLLGGPWGWRIWWRDARRTPSPNAGHPMAAMAGVLRRRLVKRGEYALGDPGPPVGPVELRQAVRRMWGVLVLAAALAALAA